IGRSLKTRSASTIGRSLKTRSASPIGRSLKRGRMQNEKPNSDIDGAWHCLPMDTGVIGRAPIGWNKTGCVTEGARRRYEELGCAEDAVGRSGPSRNMDQ